MIAWKRSALPRFAAIVAAILFVMPVTAASLSGSPDDGILAAASLEPTGLSAPATAMAYSDFLEDVNAGRVASVVMTGQSVRGNLSGSPG
jgi:hypothetical protein